MLGQDIPHHLPVDIGEAEIATGIVEGQLLMVEAEAVQDGGLKVMHMDWVLDHVESQVVGGPMTHAGPDAATGHPNTVSLRVMISPLAPT